jgi:hypothetical protein
VLLKSKGPIASGTRMWRNWPKNVKKRNHRPLEKVQANYEIQVNKSCRHIEFEIGDLVWLNI